MIVAILQVRNLRLREVKSLVKFRQQVSGRAGPPGLCRTWTLFHQLGLLQTLLISFGFWKTSLTLEWSEAHDCVIFHPCSLQVHFSLKHLLRCEPLLLEFQLGFEFVWCLYLPVINQGPQDLSHDPPFFLFFPSLKITVKHITSLGWTHETTARAWCTGKTQRNRVERQVGGGIRMGNTCNSMADSCQCMTKPTTIL